MGAESDLMKYLTGDVGYWLAIKLGTVQCLSGMLVSQASVLTVHMLHKFVARYYGWALNSDLIKYLTGDVGYW